MEFNLNSVYVGVFSNRPLTMGTGGPTNPWADHSIPFPHFSGDYLILNYQIRGIA